jgi:hypothetical protein
MIDNRLKSTAKACLETAEGNSMTFPQIVTSLMQEGFKGYMIDLPGSLRSITCLTVEASISPRTRPVRLRPHSMGPGLSPPLRKHSCSCRVIVI